MITFGNLKISKPYRNFFGSARTPSFDRYALSAPTSPITSPKCQYFTIVPEVPSGPRLTHIVVLDASMVEGLSGLLN